MKWTPTTICDIAEVVTKGTTPTTMGRPFTDSGVNFIKAEALNGDSNLNPEGFSFIDVGTHELLKRSILQEDDVLVTIAGAQVGRCGYTRAEHLPANTNQAVGIIRINKQKANARFVYYFFKQPSTFTLCQNVGGQAAQPNVNLTVLKNFKINLPSITEQNQIAEVLSGHDDHIENNRRRIALLEEAARLLYQEWFIRLQFPGREHTRITKRIPQGWEQKPLSELTSFLKRGIAPHYDDDAEGLVINQKCIRDGRLNLNLARHQNREFAPERQVQLGDVLVNSTGEGTLGRIAQINTPVENCTVDTHVTIVRPKPGIPIHYFGMAVMAWEPKFSTMGIGATNQTELSPAAIGKSEILLPPKALLEQFELFAEPICQQVTNLVSQNNKLRAARDLLLPRLMNGEIAV